MARGEKEYCLSPDALCFVCVRTSGVNTELHRHGGTP